MKKSIAIILGITSIFLFGPIGILIFILIYKRSLAGKGRSYSTREFRGYLQEGLRFTNGTLTGKDLRDAILYAMEQELKEKNIPAKVLPAAVASRKIFAFNWMPMLVIKNTEPGKKYFDMGIVVNYNTVTFPLLGESKENTRNNMHNMYKNERTFSGDVKSMFYRADEFKLQSEANWQQDVLDCFNNAVLE